MIEYVYPLLVTLVISCFARNSFETALVIAINFCCNEAFVRLVQSPDPWWFFLVTDACCASVLFLLNFGRTGAAVAGIYATQVLMHVVYYLGGQRDHNAYLDSLYSVAIIQLAIVCLGGIFGGGRLSRVVRAIRLVGRMGDPAHSRKVEREGTDR